MLSNLTDTIDKTVKLIIAMWLCIILKSSLRRELPMKWMVSNG